MVNPQLSDPESPFYDGPELEGLTGDTRFDLAKQIRIAARDKRIATRMERERIIRGYRIQFWTVAVALTVILIGLTLAAMHVGHFIR